MRSSMTRALWCVTMIACAPAASLAQQQAAKDYPSKPIRLVVPYAPGGSMDFIGGLLAKKIGPSVGQNMFIDNRPGGGGSIGTAVAAKAAPDGYTILHTSSSHTTLAVLFKSLPYDPVTSFVPVTQLARAVGSVLTVHPSVPAQTVKEFVALAKAHPGKLNYGTGGIGNIMHFKAEAFSMLTGIKMTHVPYKGSGQAIIDFLAGRIDAAVITASSVLSHIRAGRLRGLALTATVRWSELPDLPTMPEAGVKDYKDHMFETWYGLWFPAGVPAGYVTRVRAEAVKAFEDPETKRALAGRGFVTVLSTPQEFHKKIVDGIEFDRILAKRIGLEPQ